METINHILNRKQDVFPALKAIKELELNDCWIGAGFIRNTIWDFLHNIETYVPESDVDVIFYNDENTSLELELYLENKLRNFNPNLNWSVKNQARMKLKHNLCYSTSFEAISYWPETATCIAARIDNQNTIETIYPYGCDDLLNLILRPTPNINPSVFLNRINEKEWLKKWPKLKVEL